MNQGDSPVNRAVCVFAAILALAAVTVVEAAEPNAYLPR
jgi:hypothetical protein